MGLPGEPIRPPNWTPPDQPTIVDIYKGKDDEDFLKKTRLMLNYTSKFTFFATVTDCVLISEPSTVTAGLKRLGYWGIPAIGGGLAYNAAFTTLGSLRGKSDQWNHFFAGLSFGAVCGTYHKSFSFGLVLGSVFGLLGAIYKESIIAGYEVLPWKEGDISKRAIGHPFTHKWDWTLQKPRQGWWAKSEEDAFKLMNESDFDFRYTTRLEQ